LLTVAYQLNNRIITGRHTQTCRLYSKYLKPSLVQSEQEETEDKVSFLLMQQVHQPGLIPMAYLPTPCWDPHLPYCLQSYTRPSLQPYLTLVCELKHLIQHAYHTMPLPLSECPSWGLSWRLEGNDLLIIIIFITVIT